MSSPVLTEATLDCRPLRVGSGVAGESVGAGQVARRLRVIVGALAALVALLPVPRVARDLDARLLLVHLSVSQASGEGIKEISARAGVCLCVRLYERVLYEHWKGVLK